MARFLNLFMAASLLVLVTCQKASAIQVFRFLAQYKTGAVQEKISTIPPEQYQAKYSGYVDSVTLLSEQDYSTSRFIRKFGEEALRTLMLGEFGEGAEERIMFEQLVVGNTPRPELLPHPRPSEQTGSAYVVPPPSDTPGTTPGSLTPPEEIPSKDIYIYPSGRFMEIR